MSNVLFYRFFSGVVQGIALFVTGVCLDKILTPRENRGSKKIRTLSWFLWAFPFVLLKCMLILPPVYYGVLHPLILFITFLVILFYYYKERAWICFIHASMLILQNVLADFVSYLIMGDVKNIDLSHPDFGHPELVIRCTVVAALGIFFNTIYTLLILKIKNRNKLNVNITTVSTMLQVLCILMVLSVGRGSFDGKNNYIFYIIYIGSATIVLFSITMLIFNQLEHNVLKKNVETLQRENELKSAHYEQVTTHQHQLKKLHSDYKTVLTSMLDFIDEGKIEETEQILKDLSVRISNTKEYPFCSIPVVNAILTEKQEICKNEHIAFDTDLIIPEDIAVSDIELCMVFGNMMDNAIRACQAVKKTGRESKITAKSSIVHNYLIIKCQNTALENKKNKIWGTGYGHKILSEIAKKYAGDFQSIYKNHEYIAQISLRIKKQGLSDLAREENNIHSN